MAHVLCGSTFDGSTNIGLYYKRLQNKRLLDLVGVCTWHL